MKHLLLLICSFLSLIACQKVVDADKLLDTEEKVYIVGFLSPQDTVLRVNVNKALSSIGSPIDFSETRNDIYRIPNAEVRITDVEGNQATLSYSEELDTYLANADALDIVEGGSYSLSVTVNGVTYDASCQIPRQVPLIEHELSAEEREFGGTIISLDIRFQDFPEERNFYMLSGNYQASFTAQEGEQVAFEGSIFFESGQFLNDAVADGGALSGRSEFFIGEDEQLENGRITVQVAHMEEILFQQFRSFDLNQDADGNPFVEYSIAPNNILDEGAVGIFAGYQITEKEIVVDELMN